MGTSGTAIAEVPGRGLAVTVDAVRLAAWTMNSDSCHVNSEFQKKQA